MVICKSKQKKLEGDLKIKLCGRRLCPTGSVKCLCVKIDTNLIWQHHVNDISIKLNGANALLFKLRKYFCLNPLLNHIKSNTSRLSSAIRVLSSDTGKYFRSFLITAVAVFFISMFISVFGNCIFYNCKFLCQK